MPCHTISLFAIYYITFSFISFPLRYLLASCRFLLPQLIEYDEVQGILLIYQCSLGMATISPPPPPHSSPYYGIAMASKLGAQFARPEEVHVVCHAKFASPAAVAFNQISIKLPNQDEVLSYLCGHDYV